jgi:YggT family protein
MNGYISGLSAAGLPYGLPQHGGPVNRDAASKVALPRGSPYLCPNNPPEGSMASLFDAIMLILNLVWYVMIAQIIMSWLINFQVLNLRQPAIAQLWSGLNRLLEPIYAPLRRFMPNVPGLDLAPLAAFVILLILQRVMINNVAFFYG